MFRKFRKITSTINATVNEIKAGYNQQRYQTSRDRELACKAAEEKGRKFVAVAYHPAYAVGYAVEAVSETELAKKIAGNKAVQKVTDVVEDVKDSANMGYTDGKNARVAVVDRKNKQATAIDQAVREMVTACDGDVSLTAAIFDQVVNN